MDTTGVTHAPLHPFERMGLGKAPFRFVGSEQCLFQACPGAPVRAGGSCAFCGLPIRQAFNIVSADGKRFHVGCECVKKTGDRELVRQVSADVNRRRRAANTKRASSLIEQAKAALDRAEPALRQMPSPLPWQAASGATMYDRVAWLLAKAGQRGKVEAAKTILAAVSA